MSLALRTQSVQYLFTSSLSQLNKS